METGNCLFISEFILQTPFQMGLHGLCKAITIFFYL